MWISREIRKIATLLKRAFIQGQKFSGKMVWWDKNLGKGVVESDAGDRFYFNLEGKDHLYLHPQPYQGVTFEFRDFVKKTPWVKNVKRDKPE
jgi:hypothetical protein